MNNRQRFPGNGYRSNVLPSRISPESSIRSHPNFSHPDRLDSRNFHRPFNRMHPKSPLSAPHQVSRRGNLFVEAGRLAVDYLISHGILSPDVLSTPSSHGNSKINDNLEFSPKWHQEVAENFVTPTEGQSTARTFSGKSLSADDASEGDRRSPVLFKEKRSLLRPLSNTELRDENGRYGSLPDKAISPAGMIDNCNSVPTQQNAKEDANIRDDGAHVKRYQDENPYNCHSNNGASNLDELTQNADQLSSVHVEAGKPRSRSDLGEEDSDNKNSFSNFRPADMNLLMMVDRSNNVYQTGSAEKFTVPVNKNSTSCSSGSSAYEICSPMDKVRGEKRTLENNDAKDNPKKVKDWATDLHMDEASHLSVSDNKCMGHQELMPLPGRVAIQAVNQDSVAIGSMLPKSSIGPSMTYSEEKQLFPGSFKICDLNLMEVSDVHETHDNSNIVYSSNPGPKKETPVDIDLSMSNSCSLNNMFSKYEAPPGKGFEIIDLESDSLQGDKGIHNSSRRMQTEFAGLESFPNHLQNPSENPDVQDGYGLMLSELIGNDIHNCSSAQPGMSTMHNEIGLHHGEGILSDDDQIYMSLGEIPISLMRSWEPPTQDYEKPF
ncbi:hypothetical protein V2J09_005202 [Rumex salicifolius]